ncbi:MAG: lytic transglycosylase domain-containing protein [Thermincola sp.]|jgi:hypothetical protein|nr:lytic transglycosylase domain-containing protein [Thermincola sp.]MDT3702855.1 lytic transglycosylase domain-containing protein [Thermincola sp.]
MRKKRKPQKKIEKSRPPVVKVYGYIFRWRVFWLALLVFILMTIYYPPVGNKTVDFLSRQKPPLAKLPANAKLDPKTTVEYKKEKLAAVRTNMNSVFMIIGRSLDNKPVDNKWSVIKDNLLDAFKSYVDVLTVRIVTIDNKPVMIGEKGKIVPYDKTDKILQWAEHINTAANKYKIDPAIIASIIEQESGGDSAALSPAGAIGLMQLMPKTAQGLGVNPYDPAQNIDGGTRYFMYQYRAFGSIELALAAYNAGPNNVRNGNYQYYPETQGYIIKVPRLIQKYQRIFTRTREI